MSELSNNQKAKLAQLARRAFNLCGAKARARCTAPAGTLQSELESLAIIGTSTGFELWRHKQVGLAVGKEGLRCCDQLDYKKVEAHFLHLLGEDGRAMSAEVRGASEKRRQAQFKLIEACRNADYKLAYAANLCRVIHRQNLDDAPEKVLWMLVYTINNRAKAKRDREKLQEVAA